MPPLVRNGAVGKRRPIRIGVGGIPLINPPPPEKIVTKKQFITPTRSGNNPKRVKQGMKLDEIDKAPRLQKLSNNLRPGLKQRQVADRPLTSVNDVEPPPTKRDGSVINIGLNVFDVNPGPLSNNTSPQNRLPRNIKPNNPSPTPSKGNRLSPKMTLQMKQIHPRKLTKVIPLIPSKPRGRVPRPIQPIKRTGEMNRRPSIPVDPIGHHHPLNISIKGTHHPIGTNKIPNVHHPQVGTRENHPEERPPTPNK